MPSRIKILKSTYVFKFNWGTFLIAPKDLYLSFLLWEYGWSWCCKSANIHKDAVCRPALDMNTCASALCTQCTHMNTCACTHGPLQQDCWNWESSQEELTSMFRGVGYMIGGTMNLEIRSQDQNHGYTSILLQLLSVDILK